MKRNILATIVLISLAVLTFVQFRLLVIGARLEKLRFDQQLWKAQQNIRQALNEPNPVSDALILFLKNNPTENRNEEIAEALHTFLINELSKVEINPNFSFAITPRYITTQTDFVSNNFKPDQFNFKEYVIPLGSYFSSQIFAEKTLHIDIENLFGYLLIELDYLVIPSIISLLALLVCLWLLINILQKEQKLNSVKNDFINNLTHELKTPSFSISLSNRMARDQLKKGDLGKVAEYLQIIEKENNKLKIHTEKVLELASLENPNHQLQKEKTDVHLLIQETVKDFSEKIKASEGNIELSLAANEFNPNIDQTHFKNVFYNLIDNAIKYTDKKPLINIYSKNENGNFILKVKDNGPGISASDQKYIFDKFYRVPNNDIHKVKGFGLGLNYVNQVIKSHGGKIAVESQLGEGATFIITLPI